MIPYGKLDEFCEKHALIGDELPKSYWMVVHDDAADLDCMNLSRCFGTKALAMQYAKTLAHGNIDWRVCRVSSHNIVVASQPESQCGKGARFRTVQWAGRGR